MDRKTLMRIGLPILEQCVTAYCAQRQMIAHAKPSMRNARKQGAMPVAVIGPTVAELAAFAPGLLKIIELGFSPNYFDGNDGALHRPIEKPADVRAAVEDHWYWTDHGDCETPWLDVIVLPPDLDVRAALPPRLRSVPGGAARGTAAGVLLAALKLGGVRLIVGPDGRLASDQLRPLLVALGDRTQPTIEDQEQRVADLVSRLKPEFGGPPEAADVPLPARPEKWSDQWFDEQWLDPLAWASWCTITRCSKSKL